MAKLTGVDAGLACLDAAIQTHGGNAVALEYRLSNYWFLLRLLKIGPVSKEMILNFIAEHMQRLPAPTDGHRREVRTDARRRPLGHR